MTASASGTNSYSGNAGRSAAASASTRPIGTMRMDFVCWMKRLSNFVPTTYSSSRCTAGSSDRRSSVSTDAISRPSAGSSFSLYGVHARCGGRLRKR